jgi:hypothetical protein
VNTSVRRRFSAISSLRSRVLKSTCALPNLVDRYVSGDVDRTVASLHPIASGAIESRNVDQG